MIQSLQVKKNSHRFHGCFSGAKRANLGPSWPQSLRNRQMSTVQQHGKFKSVLSLNSNAPTCTSRQFPYKNLPARWVIHMKHIWGVVPRWSYVSTSHCADHSCLLRLILYEKTDSHGKLYTSFLLVSLKCCCLPGILEKHTKLKKGS